MSGKRRAFGERSSVAPVAARFRRDPRLFVGLALFAAVYFTLQLARAL